jgi:hypothetical protein
LLTNGGGSWRLHNNLGDICSKYCDCYETPPANNFEKGLLGGAGTLTSAVEWLAKDMVHSGDGGVDVNPDGVLHLCVP